MKLVFSEAGELMHVDSFLDYELLSEVFVADDICEPEEIDLAQGPVGGGSRRMRGTAIGQYDRRRIAPTAR